MEYGSRLPPAISTQWGRLCHGACVASGQRRRQPALCHDGQGADHQHRSHSFDGQRRYGYSTQQGREEVMDLGLKVVSISGAKGKKLIQEQQWKSKPYRQARAERSAMESLVFTLKEGFEFGEMMRRTHENVLAEMFEKVLAYNISQIIRMRKKLSESPELQRAAA